MKIQQCFLELQLKMLGMFCETQCRKITLSYCVDVLTLSQSMGLSDGRTEVQ